MGTPSSASAAPALPRLRPKGGGVVGLFLGLAYPFRALGVWRHHPTLRRYILGPVVINILLGVTLYGGSLWWGLGLIDGWMTQLRAWAATNWWAVGVQVMAPLLQGGLVLGLLLVTGLLFLQFGVILGSPFYGQLSERLEILRIGQGTWPPPLGPWGMVTDMGRAILFELKKLVLLVLVGGPLLLAQFWPGVGTAIATLGGIGLAIVVLCLDLLDAPLERRRLKFRQKLGIIFRCFPASASFGLVCWGLVSIPLINLLTIPLCVTAGTLFFCDRILELPPPPE